MSHLSRLYSQWVQVSCNFNFNSVFINTIFVCSVCVHVGNVLEGKFLHSGRHCECAHSGPFVVQPGWTARNAFDTDQTKAPKCKLVATRTGSNAEANMVEGEADFLVCYASGCVEWEMELNWILYWSSTSQVASSNSQKRY